MGKDSFEEYDLDADLDIDINALDFEWKRQANLLAKWIKLIKIAVAKRDKAEEKYRILKSTLFGKARAGGFNFEGSATDTAVNHWITTNSAFKKALQRRNRAERELSYLFGAKKTIEQKKEAIENLTKLHLAGFFSEPRISTEAHKQYADKGSKRQQQELNKRKSKRRLSNGK